MVVGELGNVLGMHGKWLEKLTWLVLKIIYKLFPKTRIFRILTIDVSRYTRILIRVRTMEMKSKSATFRYLLRYGHFKLEFRWHNWNSPQRSFQ